MFYAALTPLLPHYAEELGLSKTGAGVLAGSYALGALLAGIPAGILATRLGVKPTILIGLGGMTITTALFGFAHSESVLVLARLLQGAASSCSWTAGLAWLIADAPANARGRSDRKCDGRRDLRRDARAGDRRDRVRDEHRGARSAASRCIGLGLAAWAFATSSQHEPSGQPVSLLFSALTKRRMLASVWLVALPSISFGALGVLAPLHLDALGLGALAISGVWIVAVSFEATAAPLVGYISDRRGRILPLLVRSGGGRSRASSSSPALDARWWTYAAVIVACSFALGAFWAPSMSLASDEAEVLGLDYAFGFAIINLAWAPSQVAGSVGGGRLADVTSDAVVYLVLASLFTLTLAALWRSASSS